MFDPQMLINAIPDDMNRALIDKGTSLEAIARQLEDREEIKIALSIVDLGERSGYWRRGSHEGAPRLDRFDRDMERLGEAWGSWASVTVELGLKRHYPRVVTFRRKE